MLGPKFGLHFDPLVHIDENFDVEKKFVSSPLHLGDLLSFEFLKNQEAYVDKNYRNYSL